MSLTFTPPPVQSASPIFLNSSLYATTSFWSAKFLSTDFIISRLHFPGTGVGVTVGVGVLVGVIVGVGVFLGVNVGVGVFVGVAVGVGVFVGVTVGVGVLVGVTVGVGVGVVQAIPVWQIDAAPTLPRLALLQSSPCKILKSVWYDPQAIPLSDFLVIRTVLETPEASSIVCVSIFPLSQHTTFPSLG